VNFIGNGESIDGFGVDLKLSSFEAEEFYCEAVRMWFEKEKGYAALSMTSREFVVNDGFEDLASVYIVDSVLRVKSISESSYEVLIMLLEFIAEHHRKTIEVYNYLEENEQEILGWPDSDLYKKDKGVYTPKKASIDALDNEEESDEEESDEWI